MPSSDESRRKNIITKCFGYLGALDGLVHGLVHGRASLEWYVWNVHRYALIALVSFVGSSILVVGGHW
jgi:hypothetical protein